jgi:hypothetical protein
MKYAFIIGSNAFVVPSKVITYAENGSDNEFLRINSIHHDQAPPSPQTYLNCDINLNDLDGTPVNVVDNKLVNASLYEIQTSQYNVKVNRPDGSTLVHIHQLDDEAAMTLEHNITAELEVNTPVAVIRIFGEFKLGGLNIQAENEKLFINDDAWGNSVLAGTNQLRLTAGGVVL